MPFDLEERRNFCETYRGRRFLACRAMDAVREVIRALPEEPHSQLSHRHEAKVEGLPGSTADRKHELENMANLLLRMILTDNDGHISRDKLNSF